ncbi:MAG: hypothetical protein ACE5OY_03935 [Candidatus Bathyarchaeia archaeon]
MRINARGHSFKELNERIREAIRKGANGIDLFNVNGQRYIGDGVNRKVSIVIHGTAGNDLGAFMNGVKIVVHGNAGDGVGNTMDGGKIVIHGGVGDITGYSMRGGSIFIERDAGYRVGIHMKEYHTHCPVIVIGGLARDFLGEYMAGGRIVVLGIGTDGDPVGDFIGTGMHGGKIYIRGRVSKDALGEGAKIEDLREDDWEELREILNRYCGEFQISSDRLLDSRFTMIVPTSHRPFGKLYAFNKRAKR